MTMYYSDDGKLKGEVVCSPFAAAYIVYTYKQKPESIWQLFDIMVFGNGVSAEDYLLDNLECPLFTLLK